MRKLILFLLLAAGLYFAYARYLSNPTWLGPVQPPEKLAWRKLSRHEGGKGGSFELTQVVAVDGTKWRVETTVEKGGVLVAVYDGQLFACNAPGMKAEMLDPMPEIRNLLKRLPEVSYLGMATVNGVPCWGFKNSQAEAWIDRKTRLPSTVAIDKDGGRQEEIYTVLPIEQEQLGDELYGAGNPKPILGAYFK